MPLEIKTTGYDDFLDESANIKELIIGGPGVGKTRSSAFWPKPFYLFCEPGHGAIADRGVPYVDIASSKDMLDALAYLKRLESTKKAERKYQTIVLDTIDGFLRKTKDEWLQQTKAGTFSGYDAWGFLDQKMQMVLTRLLNSDYHVIVLGHWKDKTKKDKSGEESTEMVLQLQGDVKDTIFNDFDLVGFMDTYWDAEEGQRVEKRGLTFTRTPDRPFLKDRFGIMPRWLPIEFAETDYTQQRELFLARVAEEVLPESTVVGEVPAHVEENVAKPLKGGPVPEQDPRDVPLTQFTKQQLIEEGRNLGLTFKGNTLKGEMVTAIEDARSKQAAEPAAPTEEKGTEPSSESSAESSVTDGGGAKTSSASQKTSDSTEDSPPTGESPESSAPVAETSSTTPTEPPSQPTVSDSEASPSESSTADESTPSEKSTAAVTEQAAVKQVEEKLGGKVIEQQDDPAVAAKAEQQEHQAVKQAAADSKKACADCSTDLEAQPNKDMVRLSYVKHRRYLCNDCMQTANEKKKAGTK